MRSIWKYIKRYWIWALLAPIAMVGEVAMDLIQPQLMAEIVDEGVLGLSNGGVSDLNIVLTIGRDMILWCIFGATCGVLSGVFANLCCQPLGGDLREEAFRRIMSLSFAQTNRFSTGSLVTRITNDITQIQNMVMQCIRGSFRTLLLFLGGIGCMLMLDLSFGVVIACALPLVAGCSWYFLRKTAPLFTVLQERLDRVNSVMQENVTGARVVKAYVREGYEEERFDAANEELIGTQLHILELFATMTPPAEHRPERVGSGGHLRGRHPGPVRRGHAGDGDGGHHLRLPDHERRSADGYDLPNPEPGLCLRPAGGGGHQLHPLHRERFF
ncbi:MAG: ABC transporter ATP-binding protein [Clostridiales bacterium]|nr:ABC transporter ATP-binding protein [Clostridiales bacterium]